MTCGEVLINSWSENPTLTAVYAGDKNGEDNTYAKSTPSGKLTLQIDNPTAKGFLVPGKNYYIDITEAP